MNKEQEIIQDAVSEILACGLDALGSSYIFSLSKPKVTDDDCPNYVDIDISLSLNTNLSKKAFDKIRNLVKTEDLSALT